MDKTILYHITYGMYVVGAFDGTQPAGCIINTCIQVTSENPIIAISLNKNNYTHQIIKKNGKFSISIIAEETDNLIIPIFGFQCSREKNKYESFGYTQLHGTPLVNGTFSGRLICEVLYMAENETHDVIFARLLDTISGEGHPMSYEYYHKVIKGKAPKNAPTYQGETETEQDKAEKSNKYVCSICGYIYEGNKVPAGYTCPICQAPESLFSKA